jgi:hypothetical protein
MIALGSFLNLVNMAIRKKTTHLNPYRSGVILALKTSLPPVPRLPAEAPALVTPVLIKKLGKLLSKKYKE